KAAAQVAAFMPADRLRTLPSARATCMALWGVEARRRSHGPGFWRKFAGWTRNLEAVPVKKTTPSRPRPPPKTEDSRSPGKLSWVPVVDTDCVEPRNTPRIHQLPPGLPVPSQRAY